MLVYLGKSPGFRICSLKFLRRVSVWRLIPTDENLEDPVVSGWEDRLDQVFGWFSNWVEKLIPDVKYVKIHSWDTWSMDHSLAHIVVPMLKQLRDTKHGSPITELEDVPEDLHPQQQPCAANNWNDSTVHLRWQWVLDEMIWAFEQELDPTCEDRFFDSSQVDHTQNVMVQIKQTKIDQAGLENHRRRQQNGFKLFGKYYSSLWD